MTFNETCLLLINATSPEDVFPEVTDAKSLHSATRALMAAVHPDSNPSNAADAHAAFARVVDWSDKASEKITSGKWRDGQLFQIGRVTGVRGDYDVYGTILRREMLFDSFEARGPSSGIWPRVILRAPRKHRYGLLTSNAQNALLRVAGPGVPALVDVVTNAKTSMYLTGPLPAGARPLEGILTQYSEGVSVKDAIAYTLSLLSIVGRIQHAPVVHGAINPSSVWVIPATHEVFLEDWHYSTHVGLPITYKNDTFIECQPWEVREGHPVDNSTDLTAAMLLLEYMVGTQEIPDRLRQLFIIHRREGQSRPREVPNTITILHRIHNELPTP